VAQLVKRKNEEININISFFDMCVIIKNLYQKVNLFSLKIQLYFTYDQKRFYFLNQMLRKLASPYFVENDIYEYDRLQWATGVTRQDLFKAVKLIEDNIKKAKG